jgi:PAS domain S-box-containing protein
MRDRVQHDGRDAAKDFYALRSRGSDGESPSGGKYQSDPADILVPGDDDTRLRLADLYSHRDAFLRSGTVAEGVRPIVRESWERCRAFGIDPAGLKEQPFDADRLSEALRRNRRLVEIAVPYLERIHETLGAQPHVVAVAGRDARILRLLSDSETARGAKQTNLFEGASWAEDDIGCNGVGTALVSQKPVVLIGPEHFQEAYVGWTCIGVPLRDQAGRIIGALDLSVPNAHVQTHTWGWVLSIAHAIELTLSSTNGHSNGADHSGSIEERLARFEEPFQAVRGVLELVAGEVQIAPTHAEFISEAVHKADEATRLLKSMIAEILRNKEALRERDRRLQRLADDARQEADLARDKSMLLDALMAYVPEGITIADAPDVTIRLVSEHGRELTGRSADDLEGIPVDHHADTWHIYHTDGTTPARNEDLPLTRATRHGEVVINEEWLLERADGTRITILCNAGPIRNKEGHITGGLIAWRDISARKQMELELRQAKEEMERRVEERTADLAARNRELQNFAYIASHDMREPLRKIQSFGDLMKSDLGDRLGTDGHAYLDRMSGAAQRMSNLLDDLLVFSRVSTHVRPFSRVSLEDVLEEVRDEYTDELRARGAELEIDVSGVIEADRAQLIHMIGHLIGNALKYSRDGVPPRIRVYTVDAARPGLCEVVVEDNGIGIEERFVDRIFEPFQRLHGRDLYGGGTGMGLAICQRIAERHGGVISVRSELGEGSRFVVSLLCVQDKSEK